ncbi:MAG: penicillin-binding protein [Deltaproteobacteria bacterium]|nr:penicillin-binding protein [Deltaproteobacteria bacterium]
MKKKKIFEKGIGQRKRRRRIALLSLFYLLSFSLLVYRCLYLHLAVDPKLEKLARNQYTTRIEEAPPRGNIYDASGEELAISVPSYSVAARPTKIKDRERTIAELSSVLGIPPNKLASKMDPSKKYVWLKRYITVPEKDRLSQLNLDGIEMVKGSKRYYPNREVASQLLGAVGQDNEGLSGLELFYDRYLRGGTSQGQGEGATTYRDARGKTFETEETLDAARETHHLHLTIRKNIQYVTEKELNAACQESQAKSCTAMVIDPLTGALLAIAAYPNFNPNDYQLYNADSWRNRAVTDTFEPGSTFKTIMAATALENGVVRPEDKFFCENGAYTIGSHTIHDHEHYGALSFREILKFSSNIGIYKVGQKTGKRNFYDVMNHFGFGQKTGIDYPGEVAGYSPPLSAWQEIEFANISFGQGVRVTPIQLASSFATIANGGMRLRPYLVSKVTDSQGKTILEVNKKEVGRVLKPQTARTLIDMLKEVTEEGGTATRAALPGYTVAGKTGTAQKVIDGHYSHTKFVGSFVGIVPANAPRLVVFVSIDEPKGAIYGGVVAAPVFRKIAWASLVDLGIPPDNIPELKEDKAPLVATRRSLPPTTSLTEGGFFKTVGFNPLEEKGSFADFRGLSKRKVLSVLDQRGFSCQTVGSGIARAQEPAPGSHWQQGSPCRIVFRPD